MDFEGRASRRPMPRRLEVSDWNVDSDVRNGVSSSLARYPPTERAASEVRAAQADPNRRLSTGSELRPASSTTLRPVNRYDGDTVVASRSSDDSSASVSSWRASGAFMPSSVRRTERAVAASVPPERLQPRSIQDTRRHTSISTSDYNGVRHEREESQTVRPSWDRGTRASRANGVSSSDSSDSTPISYRPASSSVYFSPPRDHATREPTTPATVYSDASTDVMSPPFTSSITDTPTTIRSSSSTPPYTPASDSTPVRRQYSDLSPAQYTVSEVSSEDSVSEADHTVHRSSESVVETTQQSHSRSVAEESSSRREGLSLQQQREQLYAFRCDMRQVFARVDEMVDMHRDMFKSDPMSGIPQFDNTTAKETASFTSETFEQLTTLRAKFEDLSKAWRPPDESFSSNVSRSTYVTQPERTYEARRRPSQLDETSSIDTMRNRSEIASSQSMETIEPPSSTSSISSSPTSATATHRSSALERPTPRQRWEPTLSSLSNNSSSSSSSSSSVLPPPSDQSSSLLSANLPVFRPSSAVVDSSRMNVFEDFDKRMEEIRASLNSIARDRDRDRPRLSAPAPSSSPPPSTSSWDDAPLENSSQASNRIHQQTSSSNESRKDREARLRQLLQELRETGEPGVNNDDDSCAPSWG